MRSGEHRTHSGESRAVVPLGRGPDGPVAVLDNSTIGVALPAAGKPPPLRRLAQTDTRHHSVDDVLDRLCGLLADPNTDDAVRKLAPDDAYQGKLCPG
ncbi:hypothetical protein C5N14_17575 [Micromonospora sp. MW-13]|uniref:hypothetical protein n=1 Tax=Micromonospora sp. MW-13 TaxID=2094022 RepID=UPI000EB8403B|nr:hypothetical protein [Micromonospora sp. MW-13]RGC67590.1 hypothetical protein C5N14_17575 [Micromonospora sp. MW-13]